MLDRQKREMELRVKKTQDSVDDHVTQLSKQVWKKFFFILESQRCAGQ